MCFQPFVFSLLVEENVTKFVEYLSEFAGFVTEIVTEIGENSKESHKFLQFFIENPVCLLYGFPIPFPLPGAKKPFPLTPFSEHQNIDYFQF